MDFKETLKHWFECNCEFACDCQTCTQIVNITEGLNIDIHSLEMFPPDLQEKLKAELEEKQKNELSEYK